MISDDRGASFSWFRPKSGELLKLFISVQEDFNITGLEVRHHSAAKSEDGLCFSYI